MANVGIESRTTHFTLAANAPTAAQVVAAGEPVIVQGIVLSCTGSRTVSIREAGSTAAGAAVELFTVTVLANTTVVIPIPFVASNGIELVQTAGTPFVEATILHMHPGR